MNPFTTTIPSLENVTEKYKFISTAQFIEDVTSMGYTVERTSSPRQGLGMHSMVFNNPSMPKLDGLDLRLLATNSHDGTSAFKLYIQVGVGICSNMLVAFMPELAKASRIIHRGYALDKVVGAVTAVNNKINSVLDSIEEMKSIQVSPEQASEFIVKASALRDAKPFRIMDLQTVRHREQTDNNAWNVFNRVQEAVVKGGYVTQAEYLGNSGTYIGPGSKAREIISIKDRVQMNYKLWELATEILIKK